MEERKDLMQEIEIRENTPLNEILGGEPPWLLHSGISFLAGIVFIIIAGSFIFKYPDVIHANVRISSDNPPVSVYTVSGGKISRLLKSEGDFVEKGEIVAFFESTLSITDYQGVKNLIAKFDLIKSIDEELVDFCNEFSQNLELGPIQPSYSEWVRAINDGYQFFTLAYYPNRIKHLKRQLDEKEQLLSHTLKQLKSYTEIYQIALENYRRDSLLNSRGFLSPYDYERTKSEFISRRISLEEYQNQIISLGVQKNDLLTVITETQMEYIQKDSDLRLRIQASFEAFKSQVSQWEQNFVLLAPINGELVFAGVWMEKQFINPSELFFSVVPPKNAQYLVRGTVPVSGSGKLRIGNKVNITLLNYPHHEFGVLQGELIYISPVPNGDEFLIQVKLYNNLITSYNFDLSHNAVLSGSAKIITEDISLFARLFNPIKSFLKK